MSFKIAITDELKLSLETLSRRNKQLAIQVGKKMKQIAAMDEELIDHYKNLRYDLSDYKRVHVGKSYVLFFRVYKKERIVLFQKLMHHDDAYRR